MTELNIKYPATQKAPEPSGPGKVIHTYMDVTPHQGEDVHLRYLKALTVEEKDAVLLDMSRATVTFYELPEGEPFFDARMIARVTKTASRFGIPCGSRTLPTLERLRLPTAMAMNMTCRPGEIWSA